jgi:tyrosine decarboxylase / aspartate 1-decarboxylase
VVTLERESLSIICKALDKLEKGFEELPGQKVSLDIEAAERILIETAQRMQDNYPYFHPLYAGQMLKPPHSVARLAYMLALWINPNNHALDGGRCSSAMEKEAVAQLAEMFGWRSHLGHLCSGGTMANLEALWIAANLRPDMMIVASEQAHYTHERICGVLGIPFTKVPSDSNARMDVSKLSEILTNRPVGAVVATIGTTATGSIDPLPGILELQQKHGFRIHADCAYGGYFILTENLRPETKEVFDHLGEVDSIVVDPHKHGLQPYGCGCVLFKDPSIGSYYKHDSPYTYFTSSDMHLGEISLECSRPGASAVALWATQRFYPLIRGGEFARGLESGRSAAIKLYEFLKADERFMTALEPELDIVIWAPKGRTASEASRLSDAIFEKSALLELHLAKANLPRTMLAPHWPALNWDQNNLTCLRSCLMKPEHLDWVDQIYHIIDIATSEVFSEHTRGC